MFRSQILLLCSWVSIIGYSIPTVAAPPNPKLIKRVSLTLNDEPVVAALEQLATEAGIQLTVDHEALKAEGLEGVQGTLSLNSVPLLGLMQQVAVLHELSVTTDGREVRLTTLNKDRETYLEVAYPLQRIQAVMTSETELGDALDCVTENWEFTGLGEGKILEFAPTGVRIQQDVISHQKISQFFIDVEAALQGRPAVPIDPKVAGVMRKQVAFPAGDATLESQLQTLFKGINFLIDRIALGDEGIDLQAMSAAPVGKAQIQKHLEGLCESNKLTWSVREGIVVISAGEKLETRLYNIAKHITPEMGPFEIAAKVRSSPELGSWSESGEGVGNCQYLGPLLVVYQTAESHEKIAAALK